MKILGVIPSRYASSRLPGKPLAEIEGKTMIQRVYEQAQKCATLHDVVVATDDDRILAEVSRFGGKAVLTAAKHPSGTDRCYEALVKTGSFDGVVNIQGDEPFIQPEQLQLVCTALTEGAGLATLIKPFVNLDDVKDPNKVKVVFNKHMRALYFSRSVIPFDRTGLEPTYYQHIGVYAYTSDCLKEIVALAPSKLEKSESLEQLRWLENGFSISLKITELESMGVDTAEDLEKARKIARTFV